MDQVELLTAIIEASIALIGFSGLVVVLGRRSAGEWSPGDKTRLVVLLAVGCILLGCAFIALILLSAGISHTLVWTLSSVVWVILVLPVAVWALSWVVGHPEDPSASLSYLAVNLAALAAAAALQVTNAAYLTEFWPFLLGLAVTLLIGVTQFFRLLWFGLFQSRGAT